MICAWDGLLGILPPWLRREVDSWGRDTLQELRLRRQLSPELILNGSRMWLKRDVQQEDLNFCINAASRYSPWTAATAAQGYITAQGGHRIGVCGEAIIRDGMVSGMRDIRSLCIRVARDYPGIAKSAADLEGSILIIGAPGWGKTTLLRDLIREISQCETISVVDERRELFPPGFDQGKQTDVLTGCPKALGILQMLKTMGPQTIAVDEITAPEDCNALCQAACCGVRLLATAHAGSFQELQHRKLYAPLLEKGIFDRVLVLKADQTYQVERMKS